MESKKHKGINLGRSTTDDDKKLEFDLISGLHESIVHQILSFLPAKVAARTSILSKAWRHNWMAFLFLDFDENYFYKKREYFLKFVDDTLTRMCIQNLQVKKFRLKFQFFNSEADITLMNRWLDLAVKRANVEVLELVFNRLPQTRSIYYLFPQPVLATKSLLVLKLNGKLNLDHNFHRNPILCSSLRVLHLIYIHFVGDDGELIIQNFAKCCPLIEDIILHRCLGLKTFYVCGLLKLKKVRVELENTTEKVHVDAPNLQLFRYGDSRIGSSRYPCIFNVKLDCINLRCLYLRSRNSGLLFNQFFLEIFAQFPLLEILELRCCKMIEKVKIQNHRLKELKLIFCNGVVEVEIDSTSLRIFRYAGCTMRSIRLANTSTELEVTLSMYIGRHGDNVYFTSTKRKHLALRVSSLKMEIMIKFILEEMGHLPVPPLSEFEHLELCISTCWLSTFNYPDLFDALMWSCHPESVSVQTNSKFTKDFIKFLSEWVMMVRRGLECCTTCTTTAAKCWRHCLKDVKSDSFAGIDELIKIRPLHERDALLDALPICCSGHKFQLTLEW